MNVDDLVGMYAVYAFHEVTFDSEGEDLILCTIGTERLERVVEEGEFGSVGHLGERKVFDYLKKHGVKEVISPYHSCEWRKIPGYSQDIEITVRNNDLEEWACFESLRTAMDGERYLQRLVDEGIIVHEYDVQNNIFRKLT